MYIKLNVFVLTFTGHISCIHLCTCDKKNKYIQNQIHNSMTPKDISGQIKIFHENLDFPEIRGFPGFSATFWVPRSGEVSQRSAFEHSWKQQDGSPVFPLGKAGDFQHGRYSMIQHVIY